ncbi:hypothetical protein KUCAC02_000635 [Chaenocephalus aceratus]|uniref:Uncharacterized protein n=1 Tax=Chaenocephalus aceratus TaxID=36190 RepID=A0ACB9W730_CHAAC|nr:hypothetical protein KUCAC02_000635 [Chaenocephalus aceratus]
MILDMFCKRDQTPVCVKCRERDHRNHESVPIEKESKRVRIQMKKMDAEFNQMVQARSRKLEEINASAELRNNIELFFSINKERQIQTSIQGGHRGDECHRERAVFAHGGDRAEARSGPRGRRRSLSKISGRKLMKCGKEKRPGGTGPGSSPASFPSLRAPLAAKDWSQVRVYSDNIGTLRRSFTKLVDVCQALEKNLSAEEMSKASQYAVDVTLDPVTASAWLCLSADGKQVSLSSQQKNPPPPDEPRRFDSCVSVLGKQSFTSGRRYWVVQDFDVIVNMFWFWDFLPTFVNTNDLNMFVFMRVSDSMYKDCKYFQRRVRDDITIETAL